MPRASPFPSIKQLMLKLNDNTTVLTETNANFSIVLQQQKENLDNLQAEVNKVCKPFEYSTPQNNNATEPEEAGAKLGATLDGMLPQQQPYETTEAPGCPSSIKSWKTECGLHLASAAAKDGTGETRVQVAGAL